MTKNEIIENIKARITCIEGYSQDELVLNQGILLELKDLLSMIENEDGTCPPKYLEEAADDHIRKVVDAAGHPGWDWETQDIAEAFKAGAEWMKAKMMDEAYEEEVQEVYRYDDGIHCCVSVGTDYKPGTIVHVITIPKEKEQ